MTIRTDARAAADSLTIRTDERRAAADSLTIRTDERRAAADSLTIRTDERRAAADSLTIRTDERRAAADSLTIRTDERRAAADSLTIRTDGRGAVETRATSCGCALADLSSFAAVYYFPKTPEEWSVVTRDPSGFALVWASQFEVHVDQVIAFARRAEHWKQTA